MRIYDCFKKFGWFVNSKHTRQREMRCISRARAQPSPLTENFLFYPTSSPELNLSLPPLRPPLLSFFTVATCQGAASLFCCLLALQSFAFKRFLLILAASRVRQPRKTQAISRYVRIGFALTAKGRVFFALNLG